MTNKWYHRLWGTLYEPRMVTAAMVVVYGIVAANGVLIFFDQPPHTWYYLLPAGMMIVSGIGGIPAAWRGAWWAEGPLAGLAGFCFALLMILDGARDILVLGMALKPHLTTVMLVIFMAIRMMRVWPEMYAPGKGPITAQRKDQAKAATAIIAEREVRDKQQWTKQSSK